ncbi:DUF6344 domain-containing protein [Streptomyces sp. NPDC001815]|uniref:DUF6344 domain-containing protein n=1 Tax=Streptomyces sp. NPDC001815 TaxID=3154526 RepID=UPI0033196579
MTKNRVMRLWTAVITAFITLCTSLGLITTTAVAAVPETETARNTGAPQNATELEGPIRAHPQTHSLPPTMKQRIHAEAHGSSPSCRHRPPADAMATDTAVPQDRASVSAHSTRTDAATAVGGAASSTSESAGATDPGTTGSLVGDSGSRRTPPVPTGPSGATRTTVGVISTGVTAPEPATGLANGPLTRAPEVTCASTTPASDAHAVDAAPVTGTARTAAVLFPSQSSAPARLSAPAPVSAPASAAVPATVGTAAP